MRPTISEQLHETRRILQGVLASNDIDGYSAQITAMALSNLEMLEASWDKVLPFLRWDNDMALRLLQEMRGSLSPDLSNAIAQETQRAPTDALDASAQQKRNESIQELVVRVIEEGDADSLRHIHAYLLERTSRYPMRPLTAKRQQASASKED